MIRDSLLLILQTVSMLKESLLGLGRVSIDSKGVK